MPRHTSESLGLVRGVQADKSHSLNVFGLCQEKRPKSSIIKVFRKLAHLSKPPQPRGSIDLTKVEISHPVLIAHRTGCEGVSLATNSSPSDKLAKLNLNLASDSPSKNEPLTPSSELVPNLKPGLLRKVSKSIPAKCAAKLIFSNLHPPPLPVVPPKSPLRAVAKDLPNPHNFSQSSEPNNSERGSLLKPSFYPRNSSQSDVELASEEGAAAFNYHEVDSPLSSQISSASTSTSQVPSLDAGFEPHLTAPNFNPIGKGCQPGDRIIISLTAQNEFLIRELTHSKIIIANQIQERHPVM
ncbi:hypothetical protein L0F63_007404, partial [Massospora cicadina]